MAYVVRMTLKQYAEWDNDIKKHNGYWKMHYSCRKDAASYDARLSPIQPQSVFSYMGMELQERDLVCKSHLFNPYPK